MRNVLGEDSPGWQAVQQGLISKAIEAAAAMSAPASTTC